MRELKRAKGILGNVKIMENCNVRVFPLTPIFVSQLTRGAQYSAVKITHKRLKKKNLE